MFARILIALALLLPSAALAQTTTKVVPVKLWVHQAAVDAYIPRQGLPTLWDYIRNAFAEANLYYADDWDGPSGSLDRVCDIKLVLDYVDTYTPGVTPNEYYAAGLCTPQTFSAPAPFMPGIKHVASSGQPSGCMRSVFWWDTPGPAFALAVSDQWGVHTGGVGTLNDYRLIGWRIAHEHLHVSSQLPGLGSSHLDAGCDMMKYENCDCGSPGCASECNTIYWNECRGTLGMTEQQVNQSLTEQHCYNLRMDPNVRPRCDWERERFDCNNSGTVNVSDITCFSNAVNAIIFGSQPFDRRYDCNYDHQATASDITCWSAGTNARIYDPACSGS